MSMVSVSLVGNLAKDPEQICFASGKVKTTLVVAVNNSPSLSADFYRIETWGKLAELAQKYLAKGNQVGVSGRLVMEHWLDKQGKERVTPLITANQLSLPPRLTLVRDNQTDNVTDNPQEHEEPGDIFVDEPVATVKEPAPIYKTKKRACR